MGRQTLTIDDSALTIKPGKRATEASLKLQLRSSQGGEQALTLPEQAELQGVFIDGRPQPIRQEGRQVTLPLTPGKREIDLSWMTPQGVVSLYHTPLVNLGTASVNGRIHLEMPGDRWVLFAGGPRLGPAVLFWGVLLLLVPIAFGLGWSALTPLKFHHWLLLGIGLTQLEAVNALVVVGWLLALGVRSWLTLDDRDWAFNFMQIGLAIWTGSGERIWRPLNNPPRVMNNTFIDNNVRGFGLLQRDRSFARYLDGRVEKDTFHANYDCD